MRNLFTTSLFTLGLLAVSLACGGGSKNDTPAPPVITAPTIATFTASASVVDNGQPVTLAWTLGGSAPSSVTMKASNTLSTVTTTVSGASVMTGAVGAPPSPRNRQTYTLTVTNSAGTVSKAVSVVSRGVDLYTNYKWANGAIGVTGFDASGNVLVEDPSNLGGFYTISSQGAVSEFYNGSLSNSPVLNPVDHKLYFINSGGLQKMDMTTQVVTLVNSFFSAGNGCYLAFGSTGNLYITASQLDAVYKLTTPYTSQTQIASASDGVLGPVALTLDSSENVYTSNRGHGSGATMTNTISKITPTGVTTIAGVAGVKGNQNGPAAQATFYMPGGLAFNKAGTILYIVDTVNGLIRALTLATMQVSTVCGVQNPNAYRTTPDPVLGWGNVPCASGTLATGNLGTPGGILVTPDGDLLIDSAQSNYDGHIKPASVLQVTLQ